MLKKIFITGGAGYVGARLVNELLKKNYEITVYDIMYFGDDFLPKDDKNLKIIQGDIRDQKKLRESCKNHDCFVHLACISNDTSFALDLDLDDTIAIGSTVELLHNASLVHDDLQDRDELRRGAPSVWAKFGEPIAICVGDLLISAAYAAGASLKKNNNSANFIQNVHSSVSRTIYGQSADLYAQVHKPKNLNVYEQIAAAKSGPLLSMPMELPLIVAGHDDNIEACRRALNYYAIAYQIADDINDIEHDQSIEDDQVRLNAVLIFGEGSVTEDAIGRSTNRLNELLQLALKEAEALPSSCHDTLTRYCHLLSERK